MCLTVSLLKKKILDSLTSYYKSRDLKFHLLNLRNLMGLLRLNPKKTKKKKKKLT